MWNTMVLPIITSLIATGLGIFLVWLFDRKRRSDERANQMAHILNEINDIRNKIANSLERSELETAKNQKFREDVKTEVQEIRAEVQEIRAEVQEIRAEVQEINGRVAENRDLIHKINEQVSENRALIEKINLQVSENRDLIQSLMRVVADLQNIVRDSIVSESA